MRNRPTSLRLSFGFAAIAALLCIAGGCGSETVDRKTSLEIQIQQQFPQQARKTLGTAVVVNDVSCTSLTETTFNCLASVRGSNLQGQTITQNVPIDGSCDSESCIWNVKTP